MLVNATTGGEWDEPGRIADVTCPHLQLNQGTFCNQAKEYHRHTRIIRYSQLPVDQSEAGPVRPAAASGRATLRTHITPQETL